jgi:hypothetical protein
MFNYVIDILSDFVKLLPVLIFLRIVLDSIRNFIFKN